MLYHIHDSNYKDGRDVDIVDSLSLLLEAKPPGFFHFLIHAPTSHKFFVGNYYLNHLHQEPVEEGFVIIADWKQFYKEQNTVNRAIPQINQAYFSLCSAEEYINDPIAVENKLLAALQDEWNSLHRQILPLSIVPVTFNDSINSNEKTNMSVISKADAPKPFPANFLPSSPQLLSTEMSNFEAPSSSSSSAPLSSPLHQPPFLCLPLILHLRLASSCLQIGLCSALYAIYS